MVKLIKFNNVDQTYEPIYDVRKKATCCLLMFLLFIHSYANHLSIEQMLVKRNVSYHKHVEHVFD